MKKSLVVAAIAFLVFGCAMLPKGLYEVETQYYKDIRGDFYVDTFLMLKYKPSWLGYEVGVKRFDTPGVPLFYSIFAEYDGNDWVFVDTIYLRTDRNLYKFVDDDPHRTVHSGDHVEERLSMPPLAPDQIEDIMTTETITIQFHSRLTDMEPEGVEKLKVFLANKERHEPK